MNIFDDVEEYIESRPPYEKDRHWASSVVTCPRKAWYDFHGIEKTEKPTIARELKFRIGSATEAEWIKLVDKMAKHKNPFGSCFDSQTMSYRPDTLLIDRIENFCPQMIEDMVTATNEGRWDKNSITDYTAWGIPFRMKVDGLSLEIGGRLDLVCTVDHALPMLAEVKTSHMSRTNLLIKERIIPYDYLTQIIVYMIRYPGLIHEIHYIDRQTGYPYRYGVSEIGNKIIAQPGGYGNDGFDAGELFDGMHPRSYIPVRLEWMEQLYETETPPGQIVVQEVDAPKDKRKKFYVVSMAPFDHPSWLSREDYHMLAYEDGELITRKKTANKVSYSSGFCPYCDYRGYCLEEALDISS